MLSYGNSEFKLYKLYNTDDIPDTVVLIVGGIHGNEPGSYFAPSIFVQHYKVNKNQAWVIPALNKKSIQRNARGVYGDMNRKFKFLKKSDRDFKRVKKIKELILDKQVSMVLNLHDGHGFFRPKYETRKKNQYAWGQASVIDQEKLDTDIRFSDLYEIAKKVSQDVNKGVASSAHDFRIKNTQTKFKDLAQQNSLTYFAITNHKPAFAIETSKDIDNLSIKVLYQLRAIEAYLKIAGVEYERDFELNEENIEKLLSNLGKVSINDNIEFDISEIRSYVGFFPLKKRHNTFSFSNPLGSYSYSRGLYHLHIGNTHISSLKPDYFNIKLYDPPINIEIDSDTRKVQIGESIKVKDYFIIKAPNDIRVNVIGFGNKNDNFKKIKTGSMPTKYSLDKTNNLYRVEFYRNRKFAGMIVVDFIDPL